jgi:hypothetical protein
VFQRSERPRATVAASARAIVTLVACLVAELCLFHGATALARPSSSDPISSALNAVNLTTETARIDRDNMDFFGGDKFRLKFFDVFMNDPYKIPEFVPVLSSSARAASPSLASVTTLAGLRVGAGVRRGLIIDVVAEYEKRFKKPDVLFGAIEHLYEQASRDEVVETDASLRKLAGTLPESLAEPVAMIVLAAADGLKWQRLAFEGVDEKDQLFDNAIEYVAGMDSESPDPDLTRKVEDAIERVDFGYLNAGATDLAAVLDSAVTRIRRYVSSHPVGSDSSLRRISFTCQTPLGQITVNGTQDNAYRKSVESLLIVDLGGNDTYFAGGGTASSRNSISVLIDIAGNDRYVVPSDERPPKGGSGSAGARPRPRPSFGAAVLGYGFLVDLAGDDSYDSHAISQGAGVFGVGVFCDVSGNDRHRAFTASQGAGIFGLGICINGTGNDNYSIYQLGQGFGYVKGCGLLIDNDGGDTYAADDADIVFPSSQSEEHNTSLAQGVGFGKRADYIDGHSLAGGVGMLVDARGNDKYSCGVFGQGCSYWYGVGILADSSGNDEYSGIWYVQGSGAHFGVGILHDALGDDRYRATMNMAQGAGHDFSVGFLLDESGNDVYNAPNLSLGAGNANGFGIFWDKDGNDRYSVSADMTLGRANVDAPRGGLRDKMLCLGLFLDTGGKDSYSKPFARNGKTWTQTGLNEREPIPAEKGVGLDR